MNKVAIKGLGIVVAAAGLVTSAATDWVNEKKMDKKIEEKVNEALAKREEKES